MPRFSRITNPGAAGIITDIPPVDIPQEASTFAQDVIYPNGYMKQRRGWSRVNTSSQLASYYAVWRAKFSMRGVTRTYVTGTSTIASSPAACIGYYDEPTRTTLAIPFSSQFNETENAVYLPRAMYNDQLLFCDQASVSAWGTIRVGGSINQPGYSSGSYTLTANESTVSGVTHTTTNGAPESAMYMDLNIGSFTTGWMIISGRLDSGTATVLSLEGMRSSTTTALTFTTVPTAYGRLFSAVSVYNTGTATYTAVSSTITGFGTKWITDTDFVLTGTSAYDHIILNDAGTYRPTNFGYIAGGTDTSFSTSYNGSTITKVAYDIVRPPRFKDVASHKGSLWGAGIAQYPSRVYVAPPGWNMNVPPGATLPFDPGQVALTSTTKSYFLMDFIDVPTANDSDYIVAILSSPDALWVLKRNSLHAIYGSYPNFSQGVISTGIGCIDIRSAISIEGSIFFAADQGVFYAPGGQPSQMRDLCDGKVSREWRALTREGIDKCSLGVAFGYLIVSLRTLSGTQRTWAVNLRTGAWECRLSNTNPQHMFTAQVAGEIEQLFAIPGSLDGSGPIYFHSLRGMLDGTGPATDGNGTAPVGWYRSGVVTGTPTDVEPEAKMLDLAVHHNLRGQDATTTMDARVVAQEGIGFSGVFTFGTSTFGGADTFGPGAGKAAGTITSHTYDGVEREEFIINRSARQHLIELKTTNTATTNDSIEVHELALSFRDRRRRV